MAKIRIYLDEDVHKKVATALRLRGYDVISAHEAKKWGIRDKKQLDFGLLLLGSKDCLNIERGVRKWNNGSI